MAATCNSPRFEQDYQAGTKLLGEAQVKAAIPYLERAHHQCPSDYSAGRDLVLAYGKASLSKQAQALLDEILPQHNTAELHLLSAELWAEAGNHKAAAEQYQIAAKLDPSEDNVFDFGASLQQFEGDSALQVFRFGVGKYPKSEKMHLGLGSALYAQGLVDEAVAEVYRASDLNPSDPEPAEVLGQMAHIPAGLSQEILQRFASLHALYPGNARLTYYYAMAISGRWSDKPEADVSKSVALLEAATKLDPSFAEADFQLGKFYEEQDRNQDALHSYQQAVKFDPEQQSYHYRLALAYKKCGDLEGTQREMQIYQSLHGEDR